MALYVTNFVNVKSQCKLLIITLYFRGQQQITVKLLLQSKLTSKTACVCMSIKWVVHSLGPKITYKIYSTGIDAENYAPTACIAAS